MLVHEAYKITAFERDALTRRMRPETIQVDLTTPADTETLEYLKYGGEVVRRYIEQHPGRMVVKTANAPTAIHGYYLCRVEEIAYLPTPEDAATIRLAIGELQDQIDALQSIHDAGYNHEAGKTIGDYCGSNGYLVRGSDIPRILSAMEADEDPYTPPSTPPATVETIAA